MQEVAPYTQPHAHLRLLGAQVWGSGARGRAHAACERRAAAARSSLPARTPCGCRLAGALSGAGRPGPVRRARVLAASGCRQGCIRVRVREERLQCAPGPAWRVALACGAGHLGATSEGGANALIGRHSQDRRTVSGYAMGCPPTQWRVLRAGSGRQSRLRAEWLRRRCSLAAGRSGARIEVLCRCIPAAAPELRGAGGLREGREVLREACGPLPHLTHAKGIRLSP